MTTYGLKKFAILYPNDAYGIEYTNIFWDEVLARGGEITAAQTYSSAEKDFHNSIARLIGTYYLDDRADEYSFLLKKWYKEQKTINSRTTPPADLLPPRIDFEAIFIPDGVKALGQMASMLVYNDVANVRLLGTNLWNNSTLIDRGTSLIENALFVDDKNTFDSAFKRTSFFRDYVALYKEEPSIFEAQAYDTGHALRVLIENGASSRSSVRDGLAQIRNFKGVLGTLDVNESREFTRPLTLLTVKAGKIEEAAHPALRSTN
jgi:ABC-type branched-subunit amino acid transport system substrate-binding protein